MQDLAGYSFTSNHEWVLPKGDCLVIGLTDYAQHALSDIVSVELPEAGDHHYERNEELGFTESIKTTSEIRAPVAGHVVATNANLLSDPELINEDPYDEGWILRIELSNPEELGTLLDAAAYVSFIEKEKESE